MGMSVLIVGAEKSSYFLDVEKKVFSAGFKTLFVVGTHDALEKCKGEIFNVIISDLNCLDVDRIDFFEKISEIPFAAITPLIVITKPGKTSDVPQLSSVMDHIFTSDTSADLIAEYVKETVELRKKKIKKGSLSQVTVPRILFDAHSFKYSGAVIFERLQEKKIIYFERGKIVFASSNRPSERFGEYMVSQGLISMENLKMALEVSKKSSLQFGQILVEMGFIKEDTLGSLLQSQIKHILFSVFDWLMGDFFLLFDQTSSVSEHPANFQVPQLISEGIRRKFNQSQIYALLNPLSRKVTLGRNWKNIIADFPTTRTEFRLIDQVKEGSTLEDVLKDSPLSEIETLRVLFLLYSINLLRFKDEGKLEAETVKKGDVLESQAGFNEKSKKAQTYEITDPSKEMETYESEYQTNVVEVKGVKIKKGASFWKGFITACVIFGIALAGLYLYLNDYYGLLGDKSAQTEEGPKPKTTQTEVKKIQTEVKEVERTTRPVKTQVVEKNAKVSPAPRKIVKPTPKPTTKPTKRAARRNSLFKRYLSNGRVYYKAGDLDKALKNFQSAYKLNGKNDSLLVEMGLVYFELNRGIEAIEKYKEALRINPANALAHLYLGNIYQFHGKNSLAIKEYKTYLTLEPDSKHSFEVRKILKALGE